MGVPPGAAARPGSDRPGTTALLGSYPVSGPFGRESAPENRRAPRGAGRVAPGGEGVSPVGRPLSPVGSSAGRRPSRPTGGWFMSLAIVLALAVGSTGQGHGHPHGPYILPDGP